MKGGKKRGSGIATGWMLPMKCRLSPGFTLIEMLIAISIGAAITVMAFAAIRGARDANEKVLAVTQQIDEIDRVWQTMANDLLHAAPRPWYNRIGEKNNALIGAFGDRLSQSEAIIAGEEDYVLQFVRGNRQNLLNQPRSNLYMVGFRLTREEGSEYRTLWRDSWSPVDSSDEPALQQRRLLDGIEEMAFAYLSTDFVNLNNESWSSGWPVNTGNTTSNRSTTTENPGLLPAAVRVTVKLSSMGEVERIFALTAGDPSVGN